MEVIQESDLGAFGILVDAATIKFVEVPTLIVNQNKTKPSESPTAGKSSDSLEVPNSPNEVVVSKARAENLAELQAQLQSNNNDTNNKLILDYILQYSFSPSLAKNTYWVNLVYMSFPYITHFIAEKQPTMISMRNILKFLTFIVNERLYVINRKREELLLFEAVIVFAFMQSSYATRVPLTMEQFEQKYPDMCDDKIVADEKQNLFEFCNCTRFVQRLIPAKNNKEHVLDLVSRLTEGFSVRRVTGTGMTKETRNRYEIVRVEGNLTPIERPGRRLDPNRPVPIREPKKRGRPVTKRSENGEVVTV